MSKPKIGLYWCASCGGCDEAVVDLAEEILPVVEAVDIAFWPVALDFKREDVERMAGKELAACFINGAVRSTEQAEMVGLLREKSQLVVAFGSCAHLGGIPGLANLHDRASILEAVYFDAPSNVNPERTLPQTETVVNGATRTPPETATAADGAALTPSQAETAADGAALTLPELWDTVKTLDAVIPVDYYLPGCPPPVTLIADAVQAILSGSLPPRGSVLAPDVALCDECPRKSTKPEKPMVEGFKRPHEILADPETCLLAQGLICLGPATRKGCGAACIAGNMPCTGCMGPVSRVMDQGGKAIGALASLLDANEESRIEALIEGVPDIVGTFYRYSLPGSYLHRRPRGNGQGGGA